MKNSFKPLQCEAIRKTLQGSNIVCLFPTGYGKTMTYQIPAAIQYGISIVFVPLTSLIADQVQRAKANGLSPVWLSSNLSNQQEEDIYSSLNRRIPKFNIIFLTPEKYNLSKSVKRNLGYLYQRKLLKRIVFDEAHTIRLIVFFS